MLVSEHIVQPEMIWYEYNYHCRTVKYKIRVSSLAESKALHCNGSICHKNGYLLVYPEWKDVIWH
jgi:hypothetical protein